MRVRRRQGAHDTALAARRVTCIITSGPRGGARRRGAGRKRPARGRKCYLEAAAAADGACVGSGGSAARCRSKSSPPSAYAVARRVAVPGEVKRYREGRAEAAAWLVAGDGVCVRPVPEMIGGRGQSQSRS